MSMNRRDLLKWFGGASVATAAAGLAPLRARAEELIPPDGPMASEGALIQGVAPQPVDYDRIPYLQVDGAKCRDCNRCLTYCPTGIIRNSTQGRYHVIPSPDGCVSCAQCLSHCPSSAIYECATFTSEIQAALKDPQKITVAIVAPAVRYGIAEGFGGDGTFAEGKLMAALRRLGFDYVWDNQFGADVTIWEEGTELVQRIKKQINRPLPQITSCCPAWVKYAESFYPSLFPNLSTCKSPIGMMGALAKTYGAQKNNLEAFRVYTVAIMPCVAKKFEALRPELNDSGYRDIDAVIDSRELIALIKQSNIDFMNLPSEAPNPVLGQSTGAGTLFGATGGVMEAALRYAYEAVSGQTLTQVDFKAVRGLTGVRAADVAIPGGPTLKVAVVSGLPNAKPICDQVKAGTSPYHFIEVMACPGGCMNGGGQPIPTSRLRTLALQAFHSLSDRFRALV